MFQQGKIVCTNADLQNYHTQDAKPGEAAFVMSAGTLRDFAACPARWIAGFKHSDATGKKWRELVQCRVFNPDQFARQFAVRPDTYTVRVLQCPCCKSISEAAICRKCGLRRAPQVLERPWAGGADYCKKWAAAVEQRQQTAIRPDEDTDSRAAADRLAQDPIIAAWRSACDHLVWVAAEWHDAATGLTIPVRTLIPYVPRPGSEFDNALGALKITRDASHGPWRRLAYYANYHTRAAWCLDLYAAATGDQRSRFYFVVSENVPPYEPARRCLSPTFLQLGRREYETMLAAYCACLSTRTWPSYDLRTGGPDSWTLVETEPWMHQGEATSAGATPSLGPPPAPDAPEDQQEAA